MTDHEPMMIETALRDLGGRLAVPEPPDPAELTDAVLARLAEPHRRTLFGGSLLMKVAAAVVAVLLALGVLISVSPPVRAAVLHLLRFAGIELSSEAPPGPLPSSPAPLPGERSTDLPTAQRVSRFLIVVPDALGAPEQVLLIDGEPPRVVSLLFRGGTVRLDEFDGRTDLSLFKKLARDDFEFVMVGGDSAGWVSKPHEVYYVDRDGRQHVESARLSGKTLIWQRGGVTLRLEGDFTKEEALEIARSVR